MRRWSAAALRPVRHGDDSPVACGMGYGTRCRVEPGACGEPQDKGLRLYGRLIAQTRQCRRNGSGVVRWSAGFRSRVHRLALPRRPPPS